MIHENWTHRFPAIIACYTYCIAGKFRQWLFHGFNFRGHCDRAYFACLIFAVRRSFAKFGPLKNFSLYTTASANLDTSSNLLQMHLRGVKVRVSELLAAFTFNHIHMFAAHVVMENHHVTCQSCGVEH